MHCAVASSTELYRRRKKMEVKWPVLPHKPLMLSVFILGLLAGTRLACTDSSGV